MRKTPHAFGNRLITAPMRKALKRPFGKLMAPKKLLVALRGVKKPIISVGDISTLLLIRNGIVPEIAFFDFICKRRPIMAEDRRELLFMGGKLVKIKNPAGMISGELMGATGDIFSKNRKENLKVLVEGEEDLAALACMVFAPFGSIIVYGQPDRGAVLIKVGKAERRKALAIYKNSRKA